jgi:hypothetical protein
MRSVKPNPPVMPAPDKGIPRGPLKANPRRDEYTVEQVRQYQRDERGQ